MKKVSYTAIGLLLLAGSAYFLFRKKSTGGGASEKSSETTNANLQDTTSTNPPTQPVQPPKPTVDNTATGFLDATQSTSIATQTALVDPVLSTAIITTSTQESCLPKGNFISAQAYDENGSPVATSVTNAYTIYSYSDGKCGTYTQKVYSLQPVTTVDSTGGSMGNIDLSNTIAQSNVKTPRNSQGYEAY